MEFNVFNIPQRCRNKMLGVLQFLPVMAFLVVWKLVHPVPVDIITHMHSYCNRFLWERFTNFKSILKESYGRCRRTIWTVLQIICKALIKISVLSKNALPAKDESCPTLLHSPLKRNLIFHWVLTDKCMLLENVCKHSADQVMASVIRRAARPTEMVQD